MSDKHDAPHGQAAPESPAPKRADGQMAPDVMPRRALFGTGLLSAFGLLAGACSSEMGGFSSTGIGRKKSDKPAGSPPDQSDNSTAEVPEVCRDLEGEERASCVDQAAGDDGADGVDSGDDAASDPGDPSCVANETTEIDLSKFPAATGDLIPRVVIYGRTDSAMLAMKWSTPKDLGFILIATPSGKLLALHGITGADKNASGAYRPIVIDNLRLTEAGANLTELRIILQMASGSVVHNVPVSFFTSFNQKPVVDLANGGAVPANVGRWSVTRFAENGGFNYDDSVKFPGLSAGAVRGLNTISTDSKWSPVAASATTSGIQGEVTDIMGDPIPSLGDKAIMEHQVFCTYVPVTVGAATTYYRTILHIG